MLQTLGEVLPASARRFGDKTALISDGRRLGFRELNGLSNRLASSLRGIGVEAGDRVTLYAPNSWEWIVSYYAIHKAGAVANPINAMLTPEEVGFVVGDCGAKVLLASRAKGEGLLRLRGSGKGRSLREVVLIGGGDPAAAAGAHAFEDLLEAGDPDFPFAPVPPDSLSTICYTSGTTGHPKGAMHSHRNVLVNAAMTAVMHVRTGRTRW